MVGLPERVERIAVFRALVLGDLLCAVPALRAIRHRWPQAEITLIGLPWAREWATRLSCVDRFEEFPGFPGLPERAADLQALPAFFERQLAARYDLAIQLHGSGNLVNQIVACFGARHSSGFHEPDGYIPEPGLFAPWPERGHEIERLLAVVDHLGIERRGLELEFPLREEDSEALKVQWPDWPLRSRYAIVHAGAQLPSRRWPPERFAAVADALYDQGLTIVLTGTTGEAPIVRQVRAFMTSPSVDLVGRTSLWTLGALVRDAALVVSNDTGIMHVAAALGTPSVAVSSGADVSRWAPLDQVLHRVLWAPAACRPCGHPVCPYGHECALAIEPGAVVEACKALLGMARPTHPHHHHIDNHHGETLEDPDMACAR